VLLEKRSRRRKLKDLTHFNLCFSDSTSIGDALQVLQGNLEFHRKEIKKLRKRKEKSRDDIVEISKLKDYIFDLAKTVREIKDIYKEEDSIELFFLKKEVRYRIDWIKRNIIRRTRLVNRELKAYFNQTKEVFHISTVGMLDQQDRNRLLISFPKEFSFVYCKTPEGLKPVLVSEDERIIPIDEKKLQEGLLF